MQALRNQQPAVAVIIPTFNEAESIGAVMAGLPRDIVGRVIVVDGGSSDETCARAWEAGAEVIAVGRGYGLACLTGAQAAADADILVYMDDRHAGRADQGGELRFRHRFARPR
jgi:glycosyltransferase involved in cell wall biosynthesis